MASSGFNPVRRAQRLPPAQPHVYECDWPYLLPTLSSVTLSPVCPPYTFCHTTVQLPCRLYIKDQLKLLPSFVLHLGPTHPQLLQIHCKLNNDVWVKRVKMTSCSFRLHLFQLSLTSCDSASSYADITFQVCWTFYFILLNFDFFSSFIYFLFKQPSVSKSTLLFR